MSSRKIKITVERNKVENVLTELDLDNENLEIVVDVKENKKAFEYLYKSPYISDWEFVNNNQEALTENLQQKKSEESNQNHHQDGFSLEDYISDFDTLAYLVEFFWSIGKNYWQKDEFYDILLNKIKSISESETKSINMNHLMIKTLIDLYYSETDVKSGIKDTIEKLKTNSKEIFECGTISGVTQILYGKK